MVKRICKGNDIQLNLGIKDRNGNILRISDLDEYTIRIFTTFNNMFCSGSWVKSTGSLTNIVVTDTADILLISAEDLANLEEGLIYYQYHIKIADASYTDGHIDEVVEGETPFYLKDNRI